MNSLNIPGCEKRPLKVGTLVRIRWDCSIHMEEWAERRHVVPRSGRGAIRHEARGRGAKAFSGSALRPLPPVETLRHAASLGEGSDVGAMTYRLASHLGSHPRKVTTTSSAGPIPEAFGHAHSEPPRARPKSVHRGSSALVWDCHRHSTSSAAASLGLIGLPTNERRCNALTSSAGRKLEGTDEST